MAYKGISQETVMSNRKGYFVTLSVQVAKNFAKDRRIYQLPNGAYAIRKTKTSPKTCD